VDRTVDKNGNEIFLEEWEKIEFIPKVLTKEQCDFLIKDADFLNTPNNKPAYGSESDIERRNFTNHPIIKELSNKYGWETSNSPILWYRVGVSNTPHADSFIYCGRDSNQDNIVERIQTWKRTAVIFLNDGFEGGELVYPKIGVTIKPKVGSMVLSSGGYEFLHYTENATKDRYTLVVRINN
jgi:hypothetical protein